MTQVKLGAERKNQPSLSLELAHERSPHRDPNDVVQLTLLARVDLIELLFADHLPEGILSLAPYICVGALCEGWLDDPTMSLPGGSFGAD